MRITPLLVICSSLCFVTFSPAQETKKQVVCKAPALAAVKPAPKLRYKCREGATEYDDKILKWPERLQAVKLVQQALQTYNDASWWRADPDDLNACSFKKRAGRFTSDEQEKFDNDYLNRFVGDHNYRLAIVADPCYQTEFDGSVIFLLVRGEQGVAVTKVLDGYGSRVNNSVGFDSADLKGEKIIEIETANSFPPTQVNYYFSIDPKTHHAVPKNLFKDGEKFTNEIWTSMLMSSPSDLDLPEDAVELLVIKDHKFAPSFSSYTEDDEGTIESAGKKFKRLIYQWNGTYYAAK